ncbi:MAG: EAL domain-containing protein [Holophaga sp.]|nr:EAL domain-containing protein [Holophaga sp.]
MTLINLPRTFQRRPPLWMVPIFGIVAVLWVFFVWRWGARFFENTSLVGLLLLGLGGIGIVAALMIHAHVQASLAAAGQAVREDAERDFEGFLNLLPVGTEITDATGRMLYCNEKALQFFGLSESAARELDWTHPDFLVLQPDGNPMEPSDRPLNRTLLTGSRVQDVVLGVEHEKEGDWAWASVSAEPRFDEAGRVNQVIVTFEDVTKKRTAETELAIQTFRDRLTSLPNRTLFMERLAQAILRTERRKLSTAVLFLDLDRFKVVNDSLGHESGDHLLVQVAKRLRGCLRPEDTVARLGGDEFVILFEDLVSINDGLNVAERVSESMKAPFRLDAQEIYATCSMGLALCTLASTSPSDLVRDAEVAMYRAKARGEGGIEIFDPSMNSQALERFQIEGELRRALERNEFILFYQPLISLRTGLIEGWEALIRWKHPEKGMVPPLNFIPLAEETGLIVPIGKWVIEEAIRQATAWHNGFPSEPPRLMNVNISGRQFQHRELVTTVTEALDITGFEASCLKLEITESVMMRDPLASLEAMKVFRGLDIHLVIDDFGTGYSSLSYLKRFPVDTLKVDKSFVDGLGKDAESTAIVGAVISLAKSLGMRVTAEGIETKEQLEMLRALNCDQGQGYFFSRPLPAAQAEELLTKNPTW